MELNKNMMQKTVLALVLLAVAALSAFVVSERVSAPEYHKASMEALEEKKITVMEMTAAVAASSIAVAAIPGDATTPLADQIAELGSYLMIAAGAVMLEKFLLAITGHAAFSLLIPAACVLGILGMFLSSGVLKRLALRLAVTGLAIFMVIPASLKVSSLIEEAFEVSQTIEEAEKAAGAVEEEAAEASGEEKGLSGWILGVGEKLNGAVDQAKKALGRFVDAVAVLIIINCVIPVLVLCVVCIDVASSFRVSPARTIGLGFVALYGGETAGQLFAHSLEATGVSMFDLTLVTLVAVSLLFIAHLFLFTETDLIKIGIGEVSLMGTVPEEAADDPADPVDPCALIAERFALSPRETDVLPLLLEGRTISRIQETLFISAGTVSTHIRHIYQKTGVDNRQELIDLAHETAAQDEAV